MKYNMCGECPHKAKGIITQIGHMDYCGHPDGKDKWGTIGFIVLAEEPPNWCPFVTPKPKSSVKSKMLGVIDYVREKIDT